MDKAKDPGIAIDDVRLIHSHVEMVNLEAKPEFNLQVVHLERAVVAEGKSLNVLVSFDMMQDIPKPLFRFTCTFVATYSRTPVANMTWEEFADAMALAHIIPFVREFVSNTTNRLPTPVLMLPPINVFALLDQYEARKKAETTEGSDT